MYKNILSINQRLKLISIRWLFNDSPRARFCLRKNQEWWEKIAIWSHSTANLRGFVERKKEHDGEDWRFVTFMTSATVLKWQSLNGKFRSPSLGPQHRIPPHREKSHYQSFSCCISVPPLSFQFPFWAEITQIRWLRKCALLLDLYQNCKFFIADCFNKISKIHSAIIIINCTYLYTAMSRANCKEVWCLNLFPE